MTFNNQGIFGFDISTYQDAATTPQVVDFHKMKAYGAAFCIIRAGQGNFIDQDWNTHIQNSLGVLPVAAYWFYDPRYSPTVQANTCLSALAGAGIKRLWNDLEFTWAGNYSASNYWKEFQEKIKAGGYKTGVYTRKTWWDDKVGSLASYFGQHPLWVAQYNTELTLIPKGWTSAMIWQDGTPPVGHEAGVESIEIDHDFWNSDFNFEAEWGIIPPTPIPPPADVTTIPHPGITRTTGTRYGWRFVLDEYDPAQVIFDTAYPSQLSQVSHVATQAGAVVGSNCGEWNDKYPTQPDYLKPINFTVCDGVLKIPRTSAQPSLLIFDDGHVLIDHRPIYTGIKHAFTGLRYLVENGVINPLLSGAEGHSRKVFFTNAAGHLFNLSTEGVYPNQGWTLPQCAEFAKALGAVNAADFGGGGDATCWADGELLLVPENINEATGEHFERYLPNHFLVKLKNGEPMGTIGHVKGTARSTTNIKSMTSSALLAVMATGDVVYGEWSTQKTDLINFDHYYKQGVRFELGELCKCVVTNLTCVEETEQGTPPPDPEPTGDIHLDAILHSDGSISGTWTDI